MGVANVVKVGPVPSRCPDAEIAKLIARVDQDGVVRLPPRAPQPPRRIIAPGAVVAIAGGPLRGFAGLYAGQTAQERELVLINILGASRQVEIAARLIVPQ